MLKQAILQTANPMTFEIGSVDPDEIVILKSISGLSPADVILFTGDFARDGGYYQGRRVGKRTPVFNFKLNPDYKNNIGVSDIRELLYRQFLEPFPESDAVQVLLKDDKKPDRYFIGYTETFPIDIFSQSTDAQVSLVCTDPYLRSAVETNETNPGGWLTVPVTYDGSADTGLEITVKVVANTPEVTIDNNGVKMKLQRDFLADDIVTVNTAIGSRRIQVNGVDIMAALTGDSRWISLKQASNILKVYGSAPSDGKAVATAYRYRSAWWGV